MKTADTVKTSTLGNAIRDWPVLVFMVIGAAFAIGATQFRGIGGFFPMVVGTAVAVLCIAEAIWHPIGSFDAEAADPTNSAARRESIWLDVVAIGWITVSIGMCYVLGMLIGIAVGTAIYLWAIAHVRPHIAVLGGVALAFGLWLGLGKLAGFRFHPGIIW